jgi:hypothetical protein
MTPFWLWVGAGCTACALAGFSAARAGANLLVPGLARGKPGAQERPGRSEPRAPAVDRAVVLDRLPARPCPPPKPTVARPESEKLALWARQIQAGERTMSVATDGCRVTWNRTCKHGHPTWLVRLGYL